MAQVTGSVFSGRDDGDGNNFHEQSTERTRLVKITSDSEIGSSFVAKTYPVRWFVLIVFSLNYAATDVVWITIGPISEIAACYYGVSLWWINVLSTSYFVTYALLFIPAARFLDALGVRTAIIASACVTTAGTWLRFAGAGRTW